MAAVTIRNIPDATHRALKARAARHGRSTEAEIRLILEAAVAVREEERLGQRLMRLGGGAWDIDLKEIRGSDPPRPADFS